MNDAFKRNLHFLVKEQIDYVIKIMLGAIAYSVLFGLIQGEDFFANLLGFTAMFSVFGIIGMIFMFYNGYLSLSLSMGSNREALVKAMHVSNVITILFVIAAVSLLSLVAVPNMENRGWIFAYYGIGCFAMMVWAMYGGIIYDKARSVGLIIYVLVSIAIPVIFAIWLFATGGNEESMEVVNATAGVQSDVFSISWVSAAILLLLIIYIPAAWLTTKIVKRYEVKA